MHTLNIKHTVCIRPAFDQSPVLMPVSTLVSHFNHGLYKQKRHTAVGNEAKTTVINCCSNEGDERNPPMNWVKLKLGDVGACIVNFQEPLELLNILPSSP